jgi:preprotein translocase subunit SecE
MKLFLYLEDAYRELVEKVTWPTWKELQTSSIIVMVSSLIIALVIALMDGSFKKIMEIIYTQLK